METSYQLIYRFSQTQKWKLLIIMTQHKEKIEYAFLGSTSGFDIFTHAQWGARVIKWAPFLRFGVTFVHANLCTHTFTTRFLGWEEGRGLFEIFSSSCKNSFAVLGKWVERFLKKQDSLKIYITMKYQFILHDKNIVRITSNQPPIPCFKPHKTWRLPTNHVNHRLLLHVAFVFWTFAWLWMFLTEFALLVPFGSLFRYCGARGKFLTLKNIVCLHTNRQLVYASGSRSTQVSHLLVIFENFENYLRQTWEYLEQNWIFFEKIWRFRVATVNTLCNEVKMGNTLQQSEQYRQVVRMHSIYSVVKEFRGSFWRKFWRSIVLLFHLKAIYLPVLKRLVHMYEMWQINGLWLTQIYICIAGIFLI